jgi:hypothetical protein
MKSLSMVCLAVLACVSGCSDRQAPVSKTPDSPRLFDTQREALQRAKGVEQTVQQQSQIEKQVIDQQGD